MVQERIIMVQIRTEGPCLMRLLVLGKSRIRDHPFKTSAYSRGGGVKNLSNLPMDSSKKLPTVGG